VFECLIFRWICFPFIVCFILFKRDGIIVTDTVEKADILNNQVQSVFTNETDTDIPDKDHSPHSKMPQINISSAGVSKLLCNLNPHKACGPDNIHG
jgi:hypothetical protein